MRDGVPVGCFPVKRDLLCFSLEEANQIMQEAYEKKQQEELDRYPPKETPL